MSSARHLVRLLVLVAVCLLTSCIDGHEEIWLNADGSGRADVTYTLPAVAARFQGGAEGVEKLLAKFLRDAPGLTSSSHEVVTDGDRLKIRVKASFDSALELREISRSDPMKKLPSSANGLAGKVRVSRHGWALDFSRTISAGNALPGSSLLPASQFKDRRLTYILHLPQAPILTNAMRTENGGRTLIWDQPLAAAVKTPFTIQFKSRIPVPTWIYLSAGAAALVIGSAGMFALRGFRKT
ncbi:hypothetical protein JIN84_21035 [Luteolibacter yonseiensis]|uniref:DUF3153 domain-containing protein n=1 Tax=Luteolibacter yonseiensis TaxID=1144680 RepID=A0A934VDK5_9BACT|nr:hypothetical protein [Luteolibacter yonseiensis]MBK1818121.1 hypothetical protein [Luteolibacter yonseiensis]